MKRTDRKETPKHRIISHHKLVNCYDRMSAPLKLISAACGEALEGAGPEQPEYLLEAIWNNVCNFMEDMEKLLESDAILEKEA